jgi:hypothetical protein
MAKAKRRARKGSTQPTGPVVREREPMIEQLRSRIIRRIMDDFGGPLEHDLPGYTKDISYSRYIKQ